MEYPVSDITYRSGVSSSGEVDWPDGTSKSKDDVCGEKLATAMLEGYRRPWWDSAVRKINY